MNGNETTSTGPIGLDIGTSRIVVARRDEKNDKKYRFEAQLNAFITLPWSHLTEKLLRQEGVFHEVEGDEIVVAGDDAQKFAEVFHVETRRPMQRGVLNPQEPHSLDVVRRLITGLFGKAAGQDNRVFFSVPAAVDNEEGGLAHHQASIEQILVDLGYDPTPIEEGLAVVFGELAASNYSGFGISCGSGLCNVCLVELSLPVVSFSIPKAGDYIDAHTAAVIGERATRVRVQKEQSFRLNGGGSDRVRNALTVYHNDVIGTLAETLRARIASAQQLPKLNRPVPVVLSGGTAMPKGFTERFVAALRTQDFPVRISEVRLSADPLNATARGALMAALANERSHAVAANA